MNVLKNINILFFSAPAILILMFTECDESGLYLHFI